jgi:hypothetical protein
MTNGEIATLIAGIATPISAAVRWAAGIIRDAMNRNTDALMAFVTRSALLEEKLEKNAAAIVEIADEVTGNHEVPRPPTAHGPLRIVERRTKGDPTR